MSIIEVSNLSFGYSDVEVLRDLSFEVKKRSFLTIAGPNGAGKSTLLNLLCRTLKPKSGSIRIDSAPIESYSAKVLARKVAVVRQEFIPVFGFTVAEMVSMARTPYFDAFGFETETDTQIVAEALEMTDTAQFAARTLAELSGGERQRVFIARALAQDATILLLDEPTSFLDLKHQVRIYDLLKRMQLKKGKTIVAVTHDINLAAQYCDLTMLIGVDDSYYIGKAEDVFSARQIEEVFDVRGFAGKIAEGKFFLPLGKFAKDAAGIITKCDNDEQK
ncbi:MAG: ABC transporter ATP-binding protein [Planctomycetota bacterium]|jgi:iron complex transport system ATP-binding protein